jgi:hypothetical protein
MGKGILPRDESNVPAAGAVAYDDLDRVYPLQIDPATGRLLVTAIITSGGSGGAGTEYTDGDADGTPTGTAILGFDGTNLRAVTTDAQGDLQVDVLSLPTVTVQATNLDIRDLNSATDSVAVTGTVGVSGVVEITNDSGNPIPVNATDLDIRNLAFATDKVDVSGSTLGANSGGDIGDVTVNGLPSDTYSVTSVDATAIGDTNIATTTAGQTLRLYYICLSANGANSADVTATVKLGATTLFKVSLKAGAIWARNIGAGRRYIAGALGDDLLVTLSAAQTVHVSAEYEIL